MKKFLIAIAPSIIGSGFAMAQGPPSAVTFVATSVNQAYDQASAPPAIVADVNPISLIGKDQPFVRNGGGSGSITLHGGGSGGITSAGLTKMSPAHPNERMLN